MKLPKIDLSKDGLKRFTLHHIEKVILGLAMFGFLAFLWLGISSEKYDKTDPDKLSKKADSAKQYVINPTNWEKVADHRIGRDRAPDILGETEPLELNGYPFGILRGHAAQSLGLRYDADIAIATPHDVEVDVLTAPVLFKKSIVGDTGLDELVAARKKGMADSDEDDAEEIPFGDALTDLQQLSMIGLRPELAGAGADRDVSLVNNVVSVSALLDHRKFWEDFDEKLKNSFGYFPDRDRPKYQLIQVQKKNNKSGKWEDTTGRMKRVSAAFSVFAPEVIAPENYDPQLCEMIPPMPLVDYREACTHSLLPIRSFDKSMSATKTVGADVASDDQPDGSDSKGPVDRFASASDDDDGTVDDKMSNKAPVRKGSDRSAYNGELDKDGPASDHKVVRFFDVRDVQPGTEYTYRFRVWLEDPNNEPGDFVKKGVDGGGRPGGGRPGVGAQGAGRGGIGALGGQGGGGDSGLGGRGGGGGDSGLGGGDSGLGGGDSGLGGRGGDGRGGKGADGEGKPKVYTKVAISDSQKHISVRNRIDRERENYEKDKDLREFFDEMKEWSGVDLRYSRSTEWVEVTVNVPEAGLSDLVGGDVTARQTRNSKNQSVNAADPVIELLVSEWSKRLGTMVSSYRQARRGDWFSFEMPSSTNVLHIVDRSIRKLTDYKFKADKFIVDLMGGESIAVRSEAEYTTPAEMLLMDEEGNVFVKNTFDTKREFLNRRFMEDELSEYNIGRSRKRKEEDKGDGRGGIGGLGGGGFGG